MATYRKYGEWPGWLVESGWSEEKGHWFLTISKLGGSTIWDGEDFEPPIRTPQEIEEYLNFLAESWPELKPPPGFIEDLTSDKDKIGTELTVEYATPQK